MKALRIIPPEPKEAGPSRVMGTKVLMPDGSEVPGVYRIELEADVQSGVWRAVIHCYAQMEPVTVGAKVYRAVPDPYLEVTGSDDPEPRYVLGRPDADA